MGRTLISWAYRHYYQVDPSESEEEGDQKSKRVAPLTREMFWQSKIKKKSMTIPNPNPNPNPPLEPPNESLARGYKLVWRLLLVSNLALGAYIFSRPRKNDTAKKDRKGMTKVPTAPPEITTSPVSEEASIAVPIPDTAKINEPVPESQWPKVFKW